MTITTQRTKAVEATMPARSSIVAGTLAVGAIILLILSGILELSGPHNMATILAICGAMVSTIAGMLAVIDAIRTHRRK